VLTTNASDDFERNNPMTNELVTVATFETDIEAEAAKSLLVDVGLSAIVADAELETLGPLLGAAAHIRVQVPAEQAEQAAAVMAEIEAHREAEGAEAEDDTAPEVTKCLECGATIPDDQTRCPACGWSYASDVPDAEV
jgi:rubrerythrin